MPKALHIHPKDNVAICTSEVKAGDRVEIIDSDGTRSEIVAVTPITFCNKIALSDIKKGDDIFKYGEVIGKAIEDIAHGCLVNHLNIASQPRAYSDEYILKGD